MAIDDQQRAMTERTTRYLAILVDLVRSERATSSMPFKKYQSLADVSTKNKRLSRRRFGRQRMPRAAFGGLDSTRTPGIHTRDWHAACARARLTPPHKLRFQSRSKFAILHVGTAPVVD